MRINPLIMLFQLYITNDINLNLNFCQQKMKYKIDSFMLCSELDSSTTNESDSTISFGQAIIKKKYLSQKTANENESIFEQSQPEQKPERITLKQIFNQYSNDPISLYTLKLSDSKGEDNFIATKFANERFGKYTTSIERQEFQLLSKSKKHSNYQQKTQSLKLTKISSILRMIQERKTSQNLCQQEKTKENLNNQVIQTSKPQNNSFIKIQDRQNLDQHQKIEYSENRERSESDIFLGIESNLSNKLFETNKKSLLSANKKIESGVKKQPLSPVPQNPERKLLKINSPRQKTNSNFRKYQGVVSGLQFSKKLRKKNIHGRNLETDVTISDFQLKA